MYTDITMNWSSCLVTCIITRFPYHEVPSIGNLSFKRYGNIYFLPFYVHIIHIFTKQTIETMASNVCFMQRHELDDVRKALYCIFRLIKCFI